jgi:hypothetical protein
MRRSHPHIRIQTYDTVQGLQWNGGRLTFNQDLVQDPASGRFSQYSIPELDQAVQRVRDLNDRGIAFHLTFNNTIESLDVDDDLGNYLLRNLQEPRGGVTNSVTVSTRALARHIRSAYPGFSLTGSICFAFRDLEELQWAFETFDKVVLLPAFAYQPEVLETLPQGKAVFILNDKCYLFCPRKAHYTYVSRCNLSGNLSQREQAQNRANEKCYSDESEAYRRSWRSPAEHELFLRIHEQREGHLRAEGIVDEAGQRHVFNVSGTARRRLLDLGVRDFKFQGRELTEARYAADVLGFFEALADGEWRLPPPDLRPA